MPPTVVVLLLAALTVLFISPPARAAGPEWFQMPTNLAVAPPARAFHGAVYDDLHGVVLVHGGVTGPNSLVRDTWSWDGQSWRSLTLQGPSVWAFAWAFDSDRGVAVLHGGLNISRL